MSERQGHFHPVPFSHCGNLSPFQRYREAYTIVIKGSSKYLEQVILQLLQQYQYTTHGWQQSNSNLLKAVVAHKIKQTQKRNMQCIFMRE